MTHVFGPRSLARIQKRQSSDTSHPQIITVPNNWFKLLQHLNIITKMHWYTFVTFIHTAYDPKGPLKFYKQSTQQHEVFKIDKKDI